MYCIICFHKARVTKGSKNGLPKPLPAIYESSTETQPIRTMYLKNVRRSNQLLFQVVMTVLAMILACSFIAARTGINVVVIAITAILFVLGTLVLEVRFKWTNRRLIRLGKLIGSLCQLAEIKIRIIRLRRDLALEKEILGFRFNRLLDLRLWH